MVESDSENTTKKTMMSVMPDDVMMRMPSVEVRVHVLHNSSHVAKAVGRQDR